MTNIDTKNVSYNMLDIVSKNFYGLYIYYKILQIKKENYQNKSNSDLLG